MSNCKVPRRVLVVDALPVNANGKVDKEALRRAAAGEAPADHVLAPTLSLGLARPGGGPFLGAGPFLRVAQS